MSPTQNFFADYLTRTGERALTKWKHYFGVYLRELTRLRSRPITFLEIGVFRGGSIPMWKEFFHPDSTLVFIDIDPACAGFEIEGTHVRIGNQADPKFLAALAKEFGPFDVVLDDGSHINAHQIASFEGLWPHMKPGGLYMVEDCHTSYWPGFGGGHDEPASFMAYAKTLMDRMHSWYTDDDDAFPFDPIAKELSSVRVYDSIVVVERAVTDEAPMSLVAQKGQVVGSRKSLEVRGRRSVFSGKDGT